MKQCTRCKQVKPVDEYDPKRRVPTELKSLCRVCCGEVGVEVRAANRSQEQNNALGLDCSSRDANLRRMGYSSYADYLSSELWSRIRARVFSLKGRRCFLCSNSATELHHNRYHTNDLTGEVIRHINPVCRACHQSIEFPDGYKGTVYRAAAEFNKKRKQLLSPKPAKDVPPGPIFCACGQYRKKNKPVCAACERRSKREVRDKARNAHKRQKHLDTEFDRRLARDPD